MTRLLSGMWSIERGDKEKKMALSENTLHWGFFGGILDNDTHCGDSIFWGGGPSFILVHTCKKNPENGVFSFFVFGLDYTRSRGHIKIEGKGIRGGTWAYLKLLYLLSRQA